VVTELSTTPTTPPKWLSIFSMYQKERKFLCNFAQKYGRFAQGAEIPNAAAAMVGRANACGSGH
jgi:hypothetical protein